MERPHTHHSEAKNAVGHEGLLELARRPAVQVMLIIAAVGQVLAAKHDAKAEPATVAVRMPAVVVTPPQRVAVASADEERLAEELAEEYRAKGFKVSDALAEEIHEAATEHGIDPAVAFGLVRAESSFRNVATSSVGAVGLTQLMPSTARWLEPGTTRSELRDPETNLRIGFKYLKKLIEKYDGDVDLALVAYNRGPGTVDKALKRGRNPDNGYAAFVRGKKNHGHKLFTR